MINWMSTDRAGIPTEGKKNTRRGVELWWLFQIFYKCFGLVRV